MRVLIIDTCYPPFLKSHYAEREELAEASYDSQWRALMDRFFGTSDAYSHFLGRLGHEAHEVVVNCEPLQRAWAVERGLRVRRGRRGRPDDSLVLSQVEEYRPDVIYVQDLNAVSVALLRTLRAQGLLVGQIASKTPSRDRLSVFHVLTTAVPSFVDAFQEHGFQTESLRLAFDPRVLTRIDTNQPRSGAAFVGAIGRSRTWHSNAVLEYAASRAPIDFWGYKVGVVPLAPTIQSRYHGEAWGIEMYEVLARAKIGLNRHGDIAGDDAINMRLYEATGVGTLLLTDAKRTLRELFEPGEEVVMYTGRDDLVEKIGYYLANEEERARIARAGNERTLRDHTYERRMRELVDILGRYAS